MIYAYDGDHFKQTDARPNIPFFDYLIMSVVMLYNEAVKERQKEYIGPTLLLFNMNDFISDYIFC